MSYEVMPEIVSQDIKPEKKLALTPAKLRTLELASLGLNRFEAAEATNTSFRTVKVHRYELLKILKARSMPHAVRIGFEQGFLTPREKELQYIDTLSPAQHEILEYLSYGYSSNEIAEMRGCVYTTVKNLRALILEKLAANTMPQAVRAAIEVGELVLDERVNGLTIATIGRTATFNG